MGNSIISLPTGRASTALVYQKLLDNIEYTQNQMQTLEEQISTGDQFQLPSQDTVAAAQVLSLQTLASQNTQYQSNVSTNQSFLNETDSVLSQVNSLLTSAQSTALSAIGTTASASQRTAAAEQISQSVQQLVTIGNTQFDGRYLFGGSNTTQPPFSFSASGAVVYSGNSQALQSIEGYSDIFQTNLSGASAFGAVSAPVQGTTFTPALNENTPLSTLNGGSGVQLGSIAISDGTHTSVVDLSKATTLGDVATLIHNDPPSGRTVDVQVTPQGLQITLEPLSGSGNPQDNLSISEFSGGHTAQQLGILQPSGVGGDGPINSTSLNPIVTTQTPLADLTGSAAQALITSPGANNDILLTANTNGSTTSTGTLLNGVSVQFVNDAPAVGQETAVFVPGTPSSGSVAGTPGTLTVHIDLGASSPQDIINAINTAAGSPFQAALDPSDVNGSPTTPITTLPATQTTSGGSGSNFDPTGLQIVNDGKTQSISFATAKTVGDIIDQINAAGAGVVASIGSNGQGIQVSSLISGADFSIGENGGNTATQLGLRTFNADTQLSALNYGTGVAHYEASPSTSTAGVDFTISQPAQNVSLNIDLSGDTTIGQVIGTINTQAAAANSTITAQLAPTGNGIQIVDSNAADGPITLAAANSSTAAVQLGLIPSGQTSVASSTVGGLQTISGSDVNPQETDSVFNALLKVSQAIQSNNSAQEQRTSTLLSNSITNLNNSLGELGARQQSLSTITTLLSNQSTDLQSAISTNYDTDMTQAISQYTAAQIAYQAGLEATGQILKITLLNYL
jgi:flagellar hook-associated protein 3 FlgL